RRTGDRKYEWRYGANWSVRDDLIKSGRETRRSALAWQIDLYINLGVRLALASPEAKPLVGDSDQVKKDLHANLFHFLRDKWLSGTYEFAGSDLIAILGKSPDALKVIEVLGKILSDHNDYLPRLGESGLRERYEAVRSTFSIRHAPPLGTLGDMWSF